MSSEVLTIKLVRMNTLQGSVWFGV